MENYYDDPFEIFNESVNAAWAVYNAATAELRADHDATARAAWTIFAAACAAPRALHNGVCEEAKIEAMAAAEVPGADAQEIWDVYQAMRDAADATFAKSIRIDKADYVASMAAAEAEFERARAEPLAIFEAACDRAWAVYKVVRYAHD